MFSLITASILGAEIIEKHFTHNKNLKGNDHYHAMDVNDLKKFISNLEKIKILRGNLIEKKSLDVEKISRTNARLIVTKKYLPKNHIISDNDITYKRSGTGISPIYWEKVVGMKTQLI